MPAMLMGSVGHRCQLPDLQLTNNCQRWGIMLMVQCRGKLCDKDIPACWDCKIELYLVKSVMLSQAQYDNVHSACTRQPERPSLCLSWHVGRNKLEGSEVQDGIHVTRTISRTYSEGSCLTRRSCCLYQEGTPLFIGQEKCIID